MFGHPGLGVRTPRARRGRTRGFLSLLAAMAAIASCARSGAEIAEIEVAIEAPAPSQPAVVRVRGFSAAELSVLESSGWTDGAGRPVVVVRVAAADDNLPAVAGALARDGDTIVFTPSFGLDPGREYRVDVDLSRLTDRRGAASITRVVALPALDRHPTTVVTRVLPSGGVWPENTLRFYIEFSRPMSRTGGLDHVRLVVEDGEEVADPFLPLDADFWNADHTRYTLFFDPGRVKRDILPNREMGRALVAGRRYAIEVAASWRDADGLPLASPYRWAFQAGPADETPVDPSAWTLETPAAGTREPFVARFPEPLDHGLLSRAVGVVAAAGTTVPGEIAIDAEERAWRLLPRDAWRAGAYDLVVLSILEDAAGNRVGRPFEVDEFSRVDESPAPERTTRRFVISAAR